MVVLFDFILWWYTDGLKKATFFLGGVFNSLINFFSIKSILPTFFSPWRRLVSAKRPGLDGLVDWILDNLVSRFVGMMMRLIILLMFLISALFFLMFAIFVYLFWAFHLFLIFGLIMGLANGI